MIDFAKHRAKLMAKLAHNHQVKLDLKGSENSSGHEHVWEMFRETVPVQERTFEQLCYDMDYKGKDAYFKVKACVGCKEKHRINYHVNR